jgi:hypothetical protein
MQKKYQMLLLGLIFDGVGMLSFAIPFIGEFSDVVWAPLKGVGIISFVEEVGILGTDFLPTFTLTWIYKYLIKKEN